MNKCVPAPGTVVYTPEVSFPMTVESFDRATYSCALVGFDPATNELVRLPKVCPEFLTPAAPVE